MCFASVSLAHRVFVHAAAQAADTSHDYAAREHKFKRFMHLNLGLGAFAILVLLATVEPSMDPMLTVSVDALNENAVN